jgi:DNA-binding transcriptional LysR family regulator
MKLQDLHVLMSVVQAGSMGKAAERLRTSQPNVSRAIADLEHALGVRLLDRHRQGVEPTEYGRALLEGGVAVFDELRQTVKNIESLADPTAGEVRIGTIPPIAASFGSAVVERLGRRYPRIVCNLLTAQTDALHRGLLDRELDLLIARKFGALADERLDFEALFDDAYVVVVGAQSRWARRRGVTLADLIDAAWALPEPASVPSVVLKDALRAAGLAYPRAVVVTNSAEVRMNLLATGRYLTVFSTSALRFSAGRRAFKALPIDLPAGRVPVGIVTLKHRTLSPTAKLFIEHAREIAKPLTKGR